MNNYTDSMRLGANNHSLREYRTQLMLNWSVYVADIRERPFDLFEVLPFLKRGRNK